MTLSSWSTTSLEEVNEADRTGLKWLQLYIFNDIEFTVRLVKRAEAAGYKALVFTVDSPDLGRRLANIRNNFFLPSRHALVDYDIGNFKPETSQIPF